MYGHSKYKNPRVTGLFLARQSGLEPPRQGLAILDSIHWMLLAHYVGRFWEIRTPAAWIWKPADYRYLKNLSWNYRETI